MAEVQRRIHTGVDLDDGLVRVVVGNLSQGSTDVEDMKIVAVAEAPATGLAKGLITDKTTVADALNKALSSVQNQLGSRPEAATFVVGGPHVSAQQAKGVVAVSNSDGIIKNDDLIRAESSAISSVVLPPGREVIQIFARGYSIDGQEPIADPTGKRGERLEVDCLIVEAESKQVALLDEVASLATIEINHRTVRSLAVVEACLPAKDREGAFGLINIGQSSTDVMLMRNGEVVGLSSIRAGLYNFINDFKIGLELDMEVAEATLWEHLDLSHAQRGRRLTKSASGEEVALDYSLMHTIASARAEEIFEIALERLSRYKPDRYILTGPGLNIKGLREFFESQTDTGVRNAQRVQLTLDSSLSSASKGVKLDVNMATAVGLSALDYLLGEPTVIPAKPRLIGRLGNKISTFKK